MDILTSVALVAMLSGQAPVVGVEGDTPRPGVIRAALARPQVGPALRALTRSASPRQRETVKKDRDSLWNGILIGAGAGAAGGVLWARGVCDLPDQECMAIATPVGVLAGAAIGATIGGILDAFTR